MKKQDCIFCQIADGSAPCHTIWEDNKHMAFLSIFPNTKGFSVVITKDHNGSYLFDLNEDVMIDLVLAAKKVAKQIDGRFADVARTGMMAEGFGVDHAHIKLFPMHGTVSDEWQQHSSTVDKYFDKYEGYMSSHDCKRADDAELAQVARTLRATSTISSRQDENRG